MSCISVSSAFRSRHRYSVAFTYVLVRLAKGIGRHCHRAHDSQWLFRGSKTLIYVSIVEEWEDNMYDE
jgi:hypothetical protein